jgi:hypothetical protein
VLSPTVLQHAQCRVQNRMVMPVILNRRMWTALLSASHCSPGLPLHYRQRARCCLRLLCRTLRVCRNCTCMLVWLMPVVVDRMTRTAWLSASHSSQGLPPHHRQGARCCLRLVCRRLVQKLYMHVGIMRTASLSASHCSPGLPPRDPVRGQGAVSDGLAPTSA